MYYNCSICGKLYETEYTSTPADVVCSECEVENIINPSLKYYIGGKEVTYEEYKRFVNGEEEIKDEEDIGVKTKAGIVEPFTDNGIPICARCDIKLNADNKSKWSDVISENKTQHICKDCEREDEKDN